MDGGKRKLGRAEGDKNAKRVLVGVKVLVEGVLAT